MHNTVIYIIIYDSVNFTLKNDENSGFSRLRGSEQLSFDRHIYTILWHPGAIKAYIYFHSHILKCVNLITDFIIKQIYVSHLAKYVSQRV